LFITDDIITFGGLPGKSRGPVSDEGLPSGEVMQMPKSRRRLPKDKTEERSLFPLTKVKSLVPLFNLLLRLLEIILKLLGLIK
jgi:hypothetical protein